MVDQRESRRPPWKMMSVVSHIVPEFFVIRPRVHNFPSNYT